MSFLIHQRNAANQIGDENAENNQLLEDCLTQH